MCKCKDTFFIKKSGIKLKMGEKCFKNQNINAHFWVLIIFHECVHR